MPLPLSPPPATVVMVPPGRPGGERAAADRGRAEGSPPADRRRIEQLRGPHGRECGLARTDFPADRRPRGLDAPPARLAPPQAGGPFRRGGPPRGSGGAGGAGGVTICEG